MLNSIISSLKGDLVPQLTSKFGLSADTAESSIGLAKDNIVGGLQSEASKGNFSEIQNLLSGNNTGQNNPIVGNITNSFMGDLTSKLGLSASQSSSIANFIIPFALQKIGGQTKGQNMGKEGILSILGGGDMLNKLPGGLGGKIGGMFGK